MDDFGIFARDLGYKPQGKSAPMKSAGIGSDRASPAPFSDDQFSDVFGGPPKYSSSNSNANAAAASSMSDFDYDSIFKGSKNEGKSKWDSAPSTEPVYDKPVYDDDIFDGLPGLKSKTVSSSSKFEENVFANIASSPRKGSGGRDHFEDLLGNLNRKEKAEPKNKNISRTASDFDDLLPGFGSSSPNNRPIPESNQTSRSSANSNQTSKVINDPFVVLESTATPGVSFVSDPLEEISKLSKPGNTKENKSSASAGVFDDLDPLGDFAKSVPAHSSGMKNSGKDGSPARVRSSMKRTEESASTEAFGMPAFKTYTQRSSQKKVPVDDYHESHQTLFEMPSVSTGSQKPASQRDSSPSYGNVNVDESNSQADQSFRTEDNTQSSEEVWLTVSEIPLFTQPTRAPPPSRPPPPIPRHASKSEKAFSTTNARHKGNDFSPASSAQYPQSHNPFRSAPKNPMDSSIDELEDFAMARNYNNLNENFDISSGDNSGSNSAAAASAAAMKDAVDRAEAKLKNAKEVRERENAKAARSKEFVQREKDEQDVLDEEILENQERLNRERQQREEEEREQRRLERERAREIEREKARQAVERATREARERAAAEARERAAADARLKSERAAVQRAQAEARSRAAAEARERAERAAAEARERANAEAREKEAKEKAAIAKAEAEARRRAERAAVDRVAAAARERAAAEARDRQAAAAAAARTSQQKNDNDLESFFNMSSRPNSAPRPRASSSDPSLDPHSQNRGGVDGTRRSSQSGVTSNMKKASSTTNIVDDLSSIFGAPPSSGDFQDVEGETEERRKARLERHQRTQERAAKAVAEKNQRDLQLQKDQEERSRFAETLDFEIKRWAAGKEGNLRALLSTLQYVLWPECGWQPVSLTDLITGASVKKVYRKATLCIHPDKVQQKGANIQQKYIAEKVFDLLKEAWNKFNSEELF